MRRVMFSRGDGDDLLRFGYHLHLMDRNGVPIFVYHSRDVMVDELRGYLALAKAVAPGGTPGYSSDDNPSRWRNSGGVDHILFRKLLRESLSYYKGLGVPYVYDEPDELYYVDFDRAYIDDQIRLHENLIRLTMLVIENV